MSNEIHSTPPLNQLPEDAREIARRAAEAARETVQRATDLGKDLAGTVENVGQDVIDETKDAAHRATAMAKDIYESVALKTGDTLACSKEYVRRNPVPVILGAVVFGAAIGYLIVSSRRKPTFSEQYEDEPLVAVREAIRTALSPVSQRVHEGYDLARSGVGNAMDRVHRFRPKHSVDSLSDQICRVGSNLKFW